MESSPEVSVRRSELERTAPIIPRSAWKRAMLGEDEVIFLCGTIGSEFDTWQRRLATLSAADALLSQQIGLDAVEKVMDELESKLREEVSAEGHRLMPRRSPGYGDLPLALSRRIIAELDAARRIGVSITASDLLVPSKSVTAICRISKSHVANLI